MLNEVGYLLAVATLLANVNSSPTGGSKVLIMEPWIPQIASDILKEHGVEVIRIQNNTKENVIENIQDVEGVLWYPPLKVDKDIIDAGKHLKVIATASAGYDHIDVKELKKRGIKLGHTPKVLNGAVADTAILLALAASRRLHEGRLKMENDEWRTHYQWLLGQDIYGSTVGIIGLGGIGQTIARKLKAFDVEKVLYSGHREKPEGKELGATFVPLDTLTKESDFIFVSVPLTNETRGMCNEEFFSKMKKTAVFINTSRGQVVDQPALAKALKSGSIFAAGLDVMTPEPLPPGHELLKLPNLVLMPHVGSATVRTRNEMAKLAARNILAGLKGEELPAAVAY